MPGMLPRRETSTLAAQERNESFRPSLSFMHRLRRQRHATPLLSDLSLWLEPRYRNTQPSAARHIRVSLIVSRLPGQEQRSLALHGHLRYPGQVREQREGCARSKVAIK